MDEGFIGYIYRFAWKECFKSKRKMAKGLGVSYENLQKVFRKLDHQKGASLITIFLFLYFCDEGIDIKSLYDNYKIDHSKRGILLAVISALLPVQYCLPTVIHRRKTTWQK